jgi:hypothetical protein
MRSINFTGTGSESVKRIVLFLTSYGARSSFNAATTRLVAGCSELSRALIEPQSNGIEVGLGEAREIGSSREVLSQQAVGVLVAATLPWTARITEVNLHIGATVKRLWPDISLPWSHVRERRSCSGNLRMSLASAATTVVVSFLGSLKRGIPTVMW